MQSFDLFGRRGQSRVVLFSIVRLLAACCGVLAVLPVALADITTTGDVSPDPTTTTTNDDLYVGNTADGSLSIGVGSTVNSKSTYIGYESGVAGDLNVNGSGATWNTQGVVAGVSGTGQLNVIDGGLVLNAAGLQLGLNVGSSGAAHVGGANSAFVTTGPMLIGCAGHGELLIDQGGLVYNGGQSKVGIEAGSTGSVTVTGNDSLWQGAGDLVIGQAGQADMLIEAGGQVMISASGIIASQAGSIAQATVTGSGSTWSNGANLIVGEAGSGTLTITDAGTVSNRFGYIGNQAGAVGTVQVTGAGSTWSTGSLRVGVWGSGTLLIADGGQVSSAWSYIAYRSGSTGLITITGAGSAWNVENEIEIGRNGGDGSINIEAGGTLQAASLDYRAVNAASHITVDGAGSTLSISDLFRMDGVLNVTNGGQVNAGILQVHKGADYHVNLDSSEINTNTLMAAPADLRGQGTVNTHGLVTDFDLVFDQTHGPQQQFVLNAAPGQNVTINLDLDSSGILGVGLYTSSNLTITDGRTITSAGGIVGLGNLADSPGDEAYGEALVDGPGTVWNCIDNLSVGVSGHGLLTISNRATVNCGSADIGRFGDADVVVTGVGSLLNVAGVLDVHDGSLTVNNGASVVADTLELSLSRCLLTGNGRINGNVFNRGRIAPGDSVGTLLIDGNYDQHERGTLEIELAGTGNDLLAITGSATLDGSLTVELLDDFAPDLHQTFTILFADSVTGAFTFHSPLFNELHYFDVIYESNAVLLEVLQHTHWGDANEDGVVSLADLQIMGDHWLSKSGTWATGDFTGDGIVNVADLQILADNWGFGVTPALAFDEAVAAVDVAIPEPASLLLLLTGGGLLLRRRVEMV